MKHRLITRGFLAFACLLGWLTSFQMLSAETNEKILSASGIKVTSPEALASWQTKMPELGFDERPLSQVMNHLRDEFPGVNFVISGQAENIPVALKLRHVGLEEILEALTFATDGQARFDVRKENLVVVQGRPRREAKPVLQAFSLHRYLDAKSQEESAEALARLEQTLESAWMMLAESEGGGPAPERPRLSIHRNTKILIAVGHPDQLAAIEEIINALQGPAPMPSHDAGGNRSGAPGAGDSGLLQTR